MGRGLTTYRDAIAALFARTTAGNRLGLERTVALLERMGNPHERFAVFHVAGTNGKGSVCATLEAVLRASGKSVAKYTSPHLVDFRERFLVNGRAIGEDEVVAFADRWTADAEELGATFFEATTAMGFEIFARRGVDVAIVETGLGGRLDSTNVVHPVVAGVTSIGIDHTEYLGTSRESIAFEKAGIFKGGVPAVVGERDAGIAELLAAEARRRGASRVVLASQDAPLSHVRVARGATRFRVRGEELATPLLGKHQAANATVALLMLEAAGEGWWPGMEGFRDALLRVTLPGRFQRVGQYLFDVAHNPDGATVLADTLAAVELSRPVIAVLSVLGDKDWRGILRALARVVDGFVLTDAPTAPPSRAWRLSEVGEYAKALGIEARSVSDFDAALRAAENLGKTVLITGSFHTVGDAMARLQVDPLES